MKEWIKIFTSLHSRLRVIERVKKITTEKEADEYLKDKFRRMLTWTFNWQYVRFWRWTSWNLFCGTCLHKFIYSQPEVNFYKIITYFLYDEDKYKKYMREKCKEIEKLFIKRL